MRWRRGSPRSDGAILRARLEASPAGTQQHAGPGRMRHSRRRGGQCAIGLPGGLERLFRYHVPADRPGPRLPPPPRRPPPANGPWWSARPLPVRRGPLPTRSADGSGQGKPPTS
jgi:hypothetical protein